MELFVKPHKICRISINITDKDLERKRSFILEANPIIRVVKVAVMLCPYEA